MTSTESALVLPAAVREELRERAAAGAPEEVCGVLVGVRRHPDGPDEVTCAVAVANVADAPRTRYELDPAETLRAIEDAEADGRAVVGFYHSHPRGPTRPSPVDRRRATWTDYVYCVATPADVAAYRFTGEEFAGLRIETR